MIIETIATGLLFAGAVYYKATLEKENVDLVEEKEIEPIVESVVDIEDTTKVDRNEVKNATNVNDKTEKLIYEEIPIASNDVVEYIKHLKSL